MPRMLRRLPANRCLVEPTCRVLPVLALGCPRDGSAWGTSTFVLSADPPFYRLIRGWHKLGLVRASRYLDQSSPSDPRCVVSRAIARRAMLARRARLAPARHAVRPRAFFSVASAASASYVTPKKSRHLLDGA